MIDKNKMMRILEMRKKLDRSYNLKPNVLKFNAHSTINHEICKALVALEILKNGGTFYCEPIFLSGKRADLLEIESGTIYEILHTETDDRLKQKEYPYPIISLKTKNILQNYKEELYPEERWKKCW